MDPTLHSCSVVPPLQDVDRTDQIGLVLMVGRHEAKRHLREPVVHQHLAEE